MRVIVCGGRDYHERDIVFALLDKFVEVLGEITTLVHGAARGADSIAAEWAELRCVPDEDYRPDYNKYPGWQAPLIRNQLMADKGAAFCIAFPGGRGTEDMIYKARAAKIPVITVWDRLEDFKPALAQAKGGG
jgi:predicted Rossmann-fold nucleotide-binding protein